MADLPWTQDPERFADVRAELARPERLEALRATGALDGGPEAGLDRWTAWLAETIGAPVAFLSLLDEHRHIFKSVVGPGPPVPEGEQLPQLPSEHSLCQLVVAGDASLSVTDVATDPYLAAIAAGAPIHAYAGVPVHADGQVLGSLCVASPEARAWTEAELTAVRHAATAVSAELSLRAAQHRLDRAQRVSAAHARIHELIAQDAPLEDILELLAAVAAHETGTGASAEDDRRLVADLDRLESIATERHRTHRRLTHRATHDAVTGLPNRALLLDRLTHALSRARRSASTTVVIFVDLDRFKVVNDSFGHQVGDRLLVGVGERLSLAVRASDTVARFGGDEFAVLAEDVAGQAEAVRLADRILHALDEEVVVQGGRHLAVRASVGVAVVPAGADAPDDVLRGADAAMYAAKRAGGGRVEFYDAVLGERAAERLRMESALRVAIADGQLHVALQPIVALTGDGAPAVEALLRWDHPELGSVPPLTFIPIAEEAGLIVEIGDWVLREACAATMRLSSTHDVALQVAVNLSPRQLDDPHLVDRVRAVLAATGLPAERLALEITESALLGATDAIRGVLQDLRALGVRVVLDDFGTGFSSLSSLREHAVDAIKVDRSFVAGVTAQDGGDLAIVTAIVGMAHALGCEVTGEGVEDEATLQRLRDLGCDHAQGYLIARPAGERELDAALSGLLTAQP